MLRQLRVEFYRSAFKQGLDRDAILTEADLDAIAEEVETSDYDIAALRNRRRGRPAMGSGPAEVVPVRIDPELRAAVARRLALCAVSWRRWLRFQT